MTQASRLGICLCLLLLWLVFYGTSFLFHFISSKEGLIMTLEVESMVHM